MRIAGAEVVHGDARAGLAVLRHGRQQARAVAVEFGDLEDDAPRIDLVLVELAQAGQRLVGLQAADPARRDVQAEEPVARRLLQLAQGLVAYLAVEAAQGALVGLRTGEQRSGRAQTALAVAQAREGLHAGDQAGGGIDKGLEDGKRLAIEHNRLQQWPTRAVGEGKQECGQLSWAVT
ncbi:hypothetical protein D3C78_792150 [compost metagenome]